MGNPAGVQARQRQQRRGKEAKRLALKIKQAGSALHQHQFASTAATTLVKSIRHFAANLQPATAKSTRVGSYQQILSLVNTVIQTEIKIREPEFREWLRRNGKIVATGVDRANHAYALLGNLGDQAAQGLTSQVSPSSDATILPRIVAAADALWKAVTDPARADMPQWKMAYQRYDAGRGAPSLLADFPQNIHAIGMRRVFDQGTSVLPELVVSVFTQPSDVMLARVPKLTRNEYDGIPVRFEVCPPAKFLIGGSPITNWLALLFERFLLPSRQPRPRSRDPRKLAAGISISRVASEHSGTLTFFGTATVAPVGNADSALFLVAPYHVLFPLACSQDVRIFHPHGYGNVDSFHVAVVGNSMPMMPGQSYVADAAVAALVDGVQYEPVIKDVGRVVGDLALDMCASDQVVEAELYGQLSGLCCVRFVRHGLRLKLLLTDDGDPSAFITIKNFLQFESVPHPQSGFMRRPDHTDSGAPVFVRSIEDARAVRLVGMLVGGMGKRVDSGGYEAYAVCPIQLVATHVGVRLTYANP
jgi:hypothetical protein